MKKSILFLIILFKTSNLYGQRSTEEVKDVLSSLYEVEFRNKSNVFFNENRFLYSVIRKELLERFKNPKNSDKHIKRVYRITKNETYYEDTINTKWDKKYLKEFNFISQERQDSIFNENKNSHQFNKVISMVGPVFNKSKTYCWIDLFYKEHYSIGNEVLILLKKKKKKWILIKRLPLSVA